jgi:hypothetical protein
MNDNEFKKDSKTGTFGLWNNLKNTALGTAKQQFFMSPWSLKLKSGKHNDE